MGDLTPTRRIVRWPRRALAFTAMGGALLAGWIITRNAIFPDQHGAKVSHFTIDSRYVKKELEVTVIVPKGVGTRPPLLIFLHGRNGDQDSELRNGPMFDALAKLGRRAPVIAFPNGGGDSYWHDRKSGAWDHYVTREVTRAVLRRYHTDPRRIAIGGTSMGGFGALDIAWRLPGTFCAVGAHSPAIWQTGGQTAPGAFDDAQDFARHDVVGAATAQKVPGRRQAMSSATTSSRSRSTTRAASSARAYGSTPARPTRSGPATRRSSPHCAPVRRRSGPTSTGTAGTTAPTGTATGPPT